MPSSVHGLHRTTPRYATRTSVPTSGPMVENSVHLPVLPPINFHYSKTLEQPAWYLDVISRPHLYGSTVLASITDPCKSPLDQQRQSLHSNPSNTQLQNGNQMVAGPQTCHGRSPLDIPPTGTDLIHRQLPGGLGGAPELRENIREMEPRIPTRTHKPQRDDGSLEKHAILRTPNHAQEHHVSHGQHQLRGVLEQTGRNQVILPARSDSKNSPVVQRKRDNPTSTTHSREIQRDQRPVESIGPNCDHRMVDPPISDSPNLDHLGTTTNRPIRHKVQLQNPNILLPDSRSSGLGSGCSISRLESHDSLCIPTTSDSHTGTTENKTGTMHSVLSCARMELQVLVSNPAEPSSGQPKKNKSNTQVTKTTPKQLVPPKSKNLTSSRVETVKRYLTTQGFSTKTTNRITKRCRKTTNQLYEAKWRIYTHWCSKRAIDPIKISTQQLGDFFTHLHEDLHRGYSAIMGYKAVINNTIKLCTLQDKCSNYHIDSLLRSIKLENPQQDNSVPKWNLTLVLNSLTKAPYEPMLQASIKHLTWKTAFLTSFATAARASELTALSRKKVAHNRNWSKVTLTTKDNFVAKNQDRQVEPEPRSFTIPALYDFAGPDLPDRFLCPVRSLRYYLHKTDYFRSPTQKSLFISHSKKITRDITVNTISNWIKNVIKLAYSNSTTQDQTLARIKAHEVRALSASVAFAKNQSYSSINKACYWRGHTTFSNFYLRDVAMEENYELHMPNVVAASTKVIHQKTK